MLSTIFKKKFSNQQLATVFVNGIFNAIDNGFEEIKYLIKEDVAFTKTPQIKNMSDNHFTMIVISANIKLLKNTFSPIQEEEISALIISEFSIAFGMEELLLKKYLREYDTFMSRVNHPSKVVLYSMSKAMFYKYKLNEYQTDYFKNLDTPNPMFLKRMDDIMKNFLWNWDAFFKRYRIQQHS